MRRFMLIALAGAMPLAPALAQKGPTSRIVDELAACRAITGDVERLACFDKASETLVAARKKGDLLVLDREVVVQRKKARFGLALTDGNVFGGGVEDQATEVKEVESTIREVGDASYGRYNIGLANGMVWQTTEPVPVPPKAGAPIKLEKALLGAFKATINKRHAVKVKRLK